MPIQKAPAPIAQLPPLPIKGEKKKPLTEAPSSAEQKTANLLPPAVPEETWKKSDPPLEENNEKAFKNCGVKEEKLSKK